MFLKTQHVLSRRFQYTLSAYSTESARSSALVCSMLSFNTGPLGKSALTSMPVTTVQTTEVLMKIHMEGNQDNPTEQRKGVTWQCSVLVSIFGGKHQQAHPESTEEIMD